MNRTQGFTLIELMIVVAIIGILAAIAIPAYQDYTIRAKITEATQMLARAKTGISEYYKTQGRMPTNMAEAGFDTNIDSQYVRSVRYNGGILTAELKALGGSANAGEVFGLSAITSPSVVEWVCGTSFVTGTGVEDKYLPPNCRGN
jgi:type IV pilus assembly protein PilA